MVHSMNNLTQKMINMLLEGSDFLIQHLDAFEIRVNEYITHARRPSRQRVNFLNALIRLKAELQSKGPLIACIEDDLALNNEEVESLIDEGLYLKESMTTCVLSLAAFFHQEVIIEGHTTMCEIEAAQLAKTKLEVRSLIHENIVELLKKKQSHKTIKLRMREAGRRKEDLMDQMEMAEESKEMIGDLLAEALTAANYL
jgi:UDP-2,3-diacylglucosamine pyrophosphatase LpxH